MPLKDTSVVHPRNATRLVRQHRPDGNPFTIGEFVAHDSSPQFGSLNHRVRPNATLLARPRFGAYGQKQTSTNRQSSPKPSNVESPGGISPPGAPRTVHDPLESRGSRCSAVPMT